MVLKWQLTRASMTGLKAVSWGFAAFSMFLLGIIALAVAGGLFVVGSNAGLFKNPVGMLLIFDAVVAVVLLIWVMSILGELQRSDLLDMRKLMYLPLSLPMVTALNFLASLLGPLSLFLAIPAVGLTLGLVQSFGALAIWVFPLFLCFQFMLSAWGFLLRGLIANLMQNKRRRRLVLAIAPLVFIVVLQLPSLIASRLSRSPQAEAWIKANVDQAVFEQALTVGHLLFPPAWFAYGAAGLLQGDWERYAGAGLGLLLLAVLGIALAHRAALRLFMGAINAGPAKQSARPVKSPKTAWRPPFLDDETAALTVTMFLHYTRHTNIRMMFVMPIVMGVIFLFLYRGGAYGRAAAEFDTSPVLPFALVMWPVFNFSHLLLNVFGPDGHGFRGLMLLPTPRYKFLLARNLALLPMVSGVSFIFLAAAGFMTQMQPLLLVAGVLQTVQLFFAYATIGNFISCAFPYPMTGNPMKGTSGRLPALAIGLISFFLAGLMSLPTGAVFFAGPFMADLMQFNAALGSLITAMLLLVLTALVYALTLAPAGAFLEVREQQILRTLVREQA